MRNLYLSAFIALISLQASAQWNTSPATNTLISNAQLDQQEVRIESDGKNGAIIAWEDFRTSLSAADIFVQRVDANGYTKWTNNGVAITSNFTDQRNVAITATSDGGAILCWQDLRNGNWDIYAQRVDSNGTVKWTANGVGVAVKANAQSEPKSVTDGADGAYIVWVDSITGTLQDIYLQHIDGNGNLLWNSNGVVINSNFDKQINPRIETDAAGGCIITWMDKRTGNYDIYAQRVNSTGTILWTSGGVLISGQADNQSNPKIEPDNAGGAIIAWQDKRNGANYDVYAQRINASGVTQWTSQGVAICTELGYSQSAVEICTKGGINGAIIAWKDGRSGASTGSASSQIYMQLINPSGVVQWASNGILIGSGINPNLAEDGAGGVVVTWQDSTGIVNKEWNVFAQRVDGSGNLMWGATPVSVGTAADDQQGPKNISDGNGGSIFAFQDRRTTIDYDVYAHHLYANGTAVGMNELAKNDALVFCYPNPASHEINFRYEGIDQEWNLQIFDVSGKLILSDAVKANENHKLDITKMNGGIYYYRISGKTSVSNGKFIIER